MHRYAVLIHARNLLIPDEDGSDRIGGAYAWKCVDASDAESAGGLAVKLLVESSTFADEIRNTKDFPPDVVAEEIHLLKPGREGRETGVVFYVDTEDEA
ncbi:MAG: hypothetical protein ACSLFQ_13625 [Thermoanaerobaculia bacterium]